MPSLPLRRKLLKRRLLLRNSPLRRRLLKRKLLKRLQIRNLLKKPLSKSKLRRKPLKKLLINSLKRPKRRLKQLLPKRKLKMIIIMPLPSSRENKNHSKESKTKSSPTNWRMLSQENMMMPSRMWLWLKNDSIT